MSRRQELRSVSVSGEVAAPYSCRLLMRICSRCKLPLPLEQFGQDRSREPGRGDGRCYTCKACRNSEARRKYISRRSGSANEL